MKPATLIASVAAAGLCMAPALAQSTSPGSAQNQQATHQDTTQQMSSIGQTLKQDLEKAGFKDVQVAPEAFIVRARNSSGQPVLMRVGPDSMTEVTTIPNQAGAQPNAAHGSTAR